MIQFSPPFGLVLEDRDIKADGFLGALLEEIPEKEFALLSLILFTDCDFYSMIKVIVKLKGQHSGLNIPALVGQGLVHEGVCSGLLCSGHCREENCGLWYRGLQARIQKPEEQRSPLLPQRDTGGEDAFSLDYPSRSAEPVSQRR